MDEKKVIDDLVEMLDNKIRNGVGHVNVNFDTADTPQMACSVPTLHQGLDDERQKEETEWEK